jgi:hypothetical protein
LILFIPEWLTWWTTEIAVTNHRFIYKAGVMRRTTTEIPIDRAWTSSNHLSGGCSATAQ